MDLRELGRIKRTLFTLEWLQNTELRHRVQIGLNKREAKNACSIFLGAPTQGVETLEKRTQFCPADTSGSVSAFSSMMLSQLGRCGEGHAGRVPRIQQQSARDSK